MDEVQLKFIMVRLAGRRDINKCFLPGPAPADVRVGPAGAAGFWRTGVGLSLSREAESQALSSFISAQKVIRCLIHV